MTINDYISILPGLSCIKIVMFQRLAKTSYRQFLFACIVAVLMLYLLTSQLTEPKKDALNIEQSVGHSDDQNTSRQNEDISTEHDSEVPVTEERLVYMTAKEFDGLREARRADASAQLEPDLRRVRVNVSDTNVQTAEQYLKCKAEEFIKKHANPWPKSPVKPTLTPFERPPGKTSEIKALIHDPDMKLQPAEIEKNLKEEIARRYGLGDENIMRIPEVQAELTENTTLIPNIVHFIWFNCHKFKLHHFLSFKSALEIHKPKLMLVHADCPPDGPHFEKLSRLAGPRLKIVKRSQPTKVWGLKVQGIEHRADVARLQIMLEVGGIYLDTDMIILKPLDPLLNYPIVLGSAIHGALSNGMILASKDSWFLKRWYQEYKFFQDQKWGHNSCYVPWGLSQLFPDLIHVEWSTFIRPNFNELALLYHEVWDWTKNYAIHIYTRYMKKWDGQEERPLREFAVLNTTYGEIARLVLWGDPKPRDVTEWL